MTLYELFNRLYQIPVEFNSIDILLDTGKSKAVDFTIETVMEDGKITGLIIVEDKQLKLPFNEEK